MPLPAQAHAHHRSMLHIVNAVFSEPAILTKSAIFTDYYGAGAPRSSLVKALTFQ